MHKQTGSPCEELLQQWSAKRELANYRKSARKLPSFKREMNGGLSCMALLLDIPLNGLTADIACGREKVGMGPQVRQPSQVRKLTAQQAR